MVLDAGALIALDGQDRRTAGLIMLGRRAAAELLTVSPVVGQVWRNGSRQARLARAFAMIQVVDVDQPMARAAGELLSVSGTADVVDALLALTVAPGDRV